MFFRCFTRFAAGRSAGEEDSYLRTFPQGPFEDMESVILRFPDRAVIATKPSARNGSGRTISMSASTSRYTRVSRKRGR
jgi:hypothetical protein